MLPYPSGNGMHMGHVLNYTMGDVITHFRRRNGWTVLRPMGWDAFGLPAENAAIREGGHPREITERNIETIRAQMKRLGWAIDWDREVSSHEPDYYRWTQWLFLKFFERGLAYRKEAPVNWCPNDQTVVANEYVVDGKCERCGAVVELRNMTQWFFKITAYADELREFDLPEGGSWPERSMTIQRNWIGRSEGAEILFRVEELDVDLPVFTTRPDTLFGATFFVVAPEHPFVEQHGSDEVREYARHAGTRRAEDRAGGEAKTGVFTGHHVTNPVNGERLPVYVADYVLMDYGTGAIMAVPAHDERDARVRGGVRPAGRRGRRTRTACSYARATSTGCPPRRPRARSSQRLREEGRGAPAVSYRLRDWSFSRQRYWGCPIPIVHCERVRRRAGARGRAAGAAARRRRLPAEGQAASGLQRGVAARRVSPLRRRRDARGGHDGHVRRLVVVLPPLRRPAQRRGAVRPRRRRLLAAGQPVHRRHRPPDGAPAVLALLRQGA